MFAEKEIAGLVRFIRYRVQVANRKGCVVGVSGGIDSAVVVALCKKAFPNTTLGISMPRFNDLSSSQRALELCQKLHVDFLPCPLYMEQEASQYGEMARGKSVLSGHVAPKMAEGNYSARLRMARLYFFAEICGSLVVGTDNATESYIGYFTKFGDGGVDINPIGEYYKDEVYELAGALSIPEDTISATPSAELYEGHTDEGEIGMTYAEVNEAIRWLKSEIVNTDLSEEKIDKIRQMHLASQHKRVVPYSYDRNLCGL